MMNTETTAALTFMLMHLSPQASLNEVLNIVEFVEGLTTTDSCPPKPIETGDWDLDYIRMRDWAILALSHEKYIHTMNKVTSFAHVNQKIRAIKEIRTDLGIGLKAAKEAYESDAIQRAVEATRPF